ncbi:hypothetical protein PHLGIDRAFT_26481 [Phlebiopsis gigantea 11061_1 CR5-6]|uniref:MICOS complex subunit n=1 Tax=Phlebiopsis gigantea (strain 11061_1 CR5-6) TaxID=745531 RepID=A0A0C3PC73_PHLG1|nr:hypothetical protein PHLGIDRAFT_26481 [Phlebiopsis gigantea 11061_1 CR5-6]
MELDSGSDSDDDPFKYDNNNHVVVDPSFVPWSLFAAKNRIALLAQSLLSIYPKADADILLQEVPSELEHQISKVRVAVTDSYVDARARVQAVVSRWIGIEQSVEHRFKSLLAPEEQLNPSLLYVGVATLTGSVLARNRNIFLRASLPPTLLVLAFNHFLPRTAANVSAYLGGLEDTYAPGLARVHDTAVAHTAMSWAILQERTHEGRAAVAHGLGRGVDYVQDATGLKIREALGLARQREQAAVAQAESMVEHAVAVVAAKTEEAKAAVSEKLEEVKEAVGEKTAEKKVETKRLV